MNDRTEDGDVNEPISGPAGPGAESQDVERQLGKDPAPPNRPADRVPPTPGNRGSGFGNPDSTAR